MTPELALLLDMDGVVVDNMPLHLEAWTRFLAELGVTVHRREFFERTSGMRTQEVLAYYLGRPFSAEESAALSERKEALYRELAAGRLVPAPGLERFLSASRERGFAIGLGTGSYLPNVSFALDALGLRRHFDALVGAEDVRRGKPDPEVFELLARRLGCPPRRCVVFEDSLLGEKAARRAGMALVAVTTAHAACEFERPDLVIADFTALTPEQALALPA